MSVAVERIENIINGVDTPADSFLKKYDPHSGELLYLVVDATAEQVDQAVKSATLAQSQWVAHPPIARGQILFSIARLMRDRAELLAATVAKETGKPMRDARGEVSAAIAQAEFFAGEGARLFARTLPSGIVGKFAHSVRQPRGVAGLIVPANTPIANIAWKLFPALICGNATIIKTSEDSPKIANLMANICFEAGLPTGLLQVIHGRGEISGAAMVAHPHIAVISFTGSTRVGREIASVAGKRLARVSLELGGKNPFVVCDDADLDQAAHWAVLSAFSNAGQRCAAASRLIVHSTIQTTFVEKMLEKTRKLNLGVGENDDFGPVINEKQLKNILSLIQDAQRAGAKILCGGVRSARPGCERGFYIEPTIIESLPDSARLSTEEAFGPVAVIYTVKNYREALALANQSDYGLTAAIHTTSVDRATHFTHNVRAGVVNVNLGTYGSEPHMPFGGFGNSGNGAREPGTEALDVYSELKNISYYFRENYLDSD